MAVSFAELGLSAELLRAISDEGYTHPTPVQAQAIPVVLEGRDVLAGAQTGTGKTAGFTLPMLHRLTQSPKRVAPRAVRALVLTPTRELAAQVEESVRTYGRYLNLKSALVFGGVGINPQIAALKGGLDVLVATPGRLLDHVGQKTVDLSQVEFLVLDEADRMLDMGFIHDIRKVLALLPKGRQNLLFSATFSDEIRTLANGILKDPAYVEVARRNADSEQVAQKVHPVDKSRKRALLSHLVTSGDWRQVLVFTRTKHGANRLAEQLEKDGIEAAAIHGNKSQNARTKALAGFKDGEVRVLVATDIAARGLDIEELPHVVNYELPNVPADYVHRIGRTGRAGARGEALSLVSADERAFLADIEKLIKKRITSEIVAGFEPGTGSAEDPEERREPRPPRNAPRSGSGRNGNARSAPRERSEGARSAGGGNSGNARAPRRDGASAGANGNRQGEARREDGRRGQGQGQRPAQPRNPQGPAGERNSGRRDGAERRPAAPRAASRPAESRPHTPAPAAQPVRRGPMAALAALFKSSSSEE
ncbi:DEAD/DEAH box helicase [Niveibacterium sp. SC-1]|uniref:DEAD/DEAH box helicase n=1 Tax=Niveibacterium sp. SC-1 TaxID=3135646 RepID=UPI00311DA2BD